MNLILVFIHLLLLKFSLSISKSNNEIQMIVDVVKSYDKPTSVVAKVCWESATDKVNLAKMLADPQKPNPIRYVTENETVDNSVINNHLLYLVDINCTGIKGFLKQVEAKRMFSKSYRWLVLANPIYYNDIVAPELEDLSILVDSEVIVAQEQHNKDIVLHTIYKIKNDTEWNIEYFGIWSVDYGLNISEDRRLISTVMRRKDFKLQNLTTSVVVSDNRTKTDLLGLSNIFIDTHSKSSFQIVNPIYEFLNATGVIVFSDTWGYFINGSWNGMIGDVHEGRADLGGTVVFMTTERMNVLEYLTQPIPIQVKFVFRQPPLSYENNLFILPFTTQVWACTGASVLILIFIVYINTKWDIKKYLDYDKRKMDQTCLPPTLSDVTLFVLSAVFQQGSSNELKGTIGRLVMFLGFLSFLFLYTSYSANIVALLQSTSDQIRTLSDLLNSKLELGVEDVSYNRYYFSEAYTANDPVRKALFKTKIVTKGPKTSFMTLEEGVKKIQTKPFAFNMNVNTGYRLVSKFFQEHEKCGLQEIDFIQNTKPWLCSRRFSPYSEMIKVGYIKIQEIGLSERVLRMIYAKKPVCSVMGGSFGSVNMVDFYPVLLILLYGMILAFILLGVEILLHRRQKLKERRNSEDNMIQ